MKHFLLKNTQNIRPMVIRFLKIFIIDIAVIALLALFTPLAAKVDEAFVLIYILCIPIAQFVLVNYLGWKYVLKKDNNFFDTFLYYLFANSLILITVYTVIVNVYKLHNIYVPFNYLNAGPPEYFELYDNGYLYFITKIIFSLIIIHIGVICISMLYKKTKNLLN